MTAAFGVTAHCAFDRHHRCPYRPGGACHGGIELRDGTRYDCPCVCHTAERTEQLDLFPTIDEEQHCG